ncbi:MAG TPA: molybdenum cofactor guanylyltransferase [Synechococcales cyanobacterium M55_K2018_004]|nr:molybdenum cofactor guanylyltransferase [Synechococcales cyanobacterium M55_K2018_004]
MVETLQASELSAIVLAGGQSSRMGRDKALIPVQGVPLLQRVCAAAKFCTDRVIIVARQGSSDHVDHSYLAQLPAGCELVIESSRSEYPQGPLVGFVHGLTQINTPWVLLLACDLPNIRGEVLQQWVGLLPHVPQEAIALLPRTEKGWEPLCGFYRSKALPSLEQFVQRGGRSFQRWLAAENVQQLSLEDPAVLFNCNTPEDLHQIGEPLL